MDVMFWVWLGIIAASIVIEVFTLKLIPIWFAIGAIIPFILSIFNINFIIQIIIFAVAALLLIIFVRKYAQRFLFGNITTKKLEDNGDSQEQTENESQNEEDDEIIIPKKSTNVDEQNWLLQLKFFGWNNKILQKEGEEWKTLDHL